MALKAVLEKKADLDALPEAQRGLYTEKEGKFLLDIDGGFVSPSDHQALKTQLGEFRDNNRTLHGELEQLRPLKAKYEGIDPDEYKTLKAEVEKLKGKGVGKADDLQAAIDAAVEKANKPLRDKLASEEAARVKAQQAADSARFRELFTAEATKAGVRASALEFVLPKAETAFELKDGAIAPRNGAKHPTEPHKDLTTADWLQHLAKTSDYLFEPSTGGGATGNGHGSGGRPHAKQLINPTPLEMGRHAKEIAKGEMVVVRQ